MADRKNILLIGMDDAFSFWRFRTVFGARLQTPNLDRICAVSSAFTSAYCQVPICGPSRASAMSGLSPYETDVFDNYTNIFDILRPEQMWQYRLKQDGYYCSTAGKIHHGYKPLPDHVHDVLYSHPSRHVFFGPKRNVAHKLFGGKMGGVGTTDPVEDRRYYDFRSSQDAIRFFKGYNSDAPFYREVGFHHPHPPFRTPVRFKEMYDIDEFIQPDDWAQGFDLSEFTGVFMTENMDSTAIDDWKKSIRNYFSAFSHVDTHIGRVWDALQASPHAKNTVVVIFSDHGYHMGDKSRFRKFTLWEEATRVPFIVHDPDAPGREVTDPVGLVDMGPTILDYARSRPMQHSVGRSLRPIVEGKPAEPRAIPTFWYGSASVRSGDHRITLYQDGSSEFYNVIDDPWLTKNLAGKSPDYDTARQTLHQTCKDYGVVVVEQGTAPDQAASFFSVHQGAQPPRELPTRGVVSVGSMAPDHDSPGYRKQFATLAQDGALEIADGIRELLFASDTSGGVRHFNVVCNDDGNRLFFAGSHDRFTLEVAGGEGDDHIETSHDSLIARLGSGNNVVRAGVSDAKVFGGSGTDMIYGVQGNNELHGGSGDSTIVGGTGNDTIHTGAGRNLIDSGEGDNRIVVDGGVNRILLGTGQNTLVFQRTALPQTVEGFANGAIDLSDWNDLGGIEVTAQGDDVILSCATERVVFQGLTEASVRDAITGILTDA